LALTAALCATTPNRRLPALALDSMLVWRVEVGAVVFRSVSFSGLSKGSSAGFEQRTIPVSWCCIPTERRPSMSAMQDRQEEYAGMDPAFAASMARVDVHLANARAHLERVRLLNEEQRRLELAYYEAYLQRRRLFRF
jgi:hypothetical protein